MTDKPSPISDEELHRYEEQARKTLESHFVRTGYDLAPTIIRLIGGYRDLLTRLDLAEAKASVTFPADHMLMPTTQYHRLMRHEEELKAAEAALQAERDKVTRLRRALEDARSPLIRNKGNLGYQQLSNIVLIINQALEEA